MRTRGTHTTRGRADSATPVSREWRGLYTVALGLLLVVAAVSLFGTTLSSAAIGTSNSAGGGAQPVRLAGGLMDPNVTLSAYEGLVSSSLNASGSGFGSDNIVDLTFGPVAINQCVSGGLTSDANGNFSCIFPVPALPASDVYGVNATNGTSEGTAGANFTILPPTLSRSPTEAQVGALVTASGAGFNGSTSLVLTLGPATLGCVAGSLTTAPDGTFSCTFQVPVLPAGGSPYTFSATDGVNVQSVPFTVETPTLVAVPGGGPVGSTVTLSGAGYAVGTPLTLTFGPTGISSCTVGTLTSNASGDLTGCSFSVPLVPAGVEKVNASDGVNVGQTEFTVSNATVSLSPNTGNVSESVRATGSGFGPDAPLTLTFGGSSVTSCTAGGLVASGSGDLDCTFPVPATPAGAEPVVASDGTNPGFSNFTVRSQLTLDPEGGAVGTAVTATGTGFGANRAYSVTWNSSVLLCSGTTDSSGTFSCFLAPIPPAYEGVHPVTATEGVNTATAGFEIFPALSLSPSAGTAGVTVSLVGTGLGATTSYAYCFLGSATACGSGAPTFVTGSDGSVPTGTSLTVPSDAPGSYFVDVSFGTALIVNASFTITSASVVLAPTAGPVGTSIAFSGSGYQVDTTYAYCFQSQTAACAGTPPTLVTTSGGDLPSGLSITAPEDPGGTYYVDLSIEALFVSAGEFTIESNLSVAPLAGVVGTSITADGTGFDASASFSILWNSEAAVCSGTSDSSGELACQFDVPYSPGGVYPVLAEQGVLEVSGSFQVLPGVAVTPSSGTVGSEGSVSGTGFLASLSGVSVTWESTTTICSSSTNGTGSFSCEFTVPASPAGARDVTASQQTVSASTSFSVVPSFYLSPNSGPVGTSVSVVGEGFDATAPFSVVWGGSLTLCTSTTTAAGGAACSFVVPSAAFGAVAVTVLEGTYSPAETFTVGAGITVAPASGVIGSTVTVTGVGFDPDAAYTVSWSTGMVLCADLTNSTGGFVCTFSIPTGPGGAHTITALEGSHTASVVLVANPYLQLQVTTDTVGSAVGATGVGFGAAAPYSLEWNATTPLCSGTTTAAGGFSCTFSIPIAPGGVTTVMAQGSGLSASAALTVGASLGLSPPSGKVGTAVKATGYGFGAESAYAVTWNSSTTLCSGTTNSNGAFACTFAVPASTPGSYTISANSATAAPTGSFTVNSSGVVPPPAAPASSSPFPWWEVGAIAAAFAVCFLAALLVLRRRRDRAGPGAVRPWDAAGSADGGTATGPMAVPAMAGTTGGATASAPAPPTPTPAGAVNAAPEPSPNPDEDIDVLMARLEQMSAELYKNKPDRLKEGLGEEADSDEAAADGTDADGKNA